MAFLLFLGNWQTTSKNCTKVLAAHADAARLFFLIRPIISLFPGVAVALELTTARTSSKGPFLFYEVGGASGIWGGSPKKNGLEGGAI